MDENCPEVWGANFASQQETEDFMKSEDGIPKRFMKELYLDGKFSGHIEIRFFEKKSNKAEELFADFPYGDKIIEVLKARFRNKLMKNLIPNYAGENRVSSSMTDIKKSLIWYTFQIICA